MLVLKKVKATLTFVHIKAMSIFIIDEIFINMIIINVSYTFANVGFNIC